MNTGLRTRHYFGICVISLLALLHLFIVIFNHYQLRTFPYYYGVYNFAFFDFAHLRCSPVPMLFDGTGSNFMQDHFSLLLPLLSPLYWLTKDLSGTYTLLIIQWLSIVCGAWGTYQYIKTRSTSAMLATGAAICYFIMYGRFASYVADFNLAIVAAALIPLFFHFFETGSRTRLIALFLILLITREDVSLWLVFICLYMMILYRRDRSKRNFAVTLALISAFYFMLVMKVIIPALETPNARFMLFNYNALGSDAGEALRFVFSHPFRSLELLFVNQSEEPIYDGIKIRFYVVHLLMGGILLLLRPAALLCFVPVIAKKMFNDDPVRWDYESYYGVEMASLLPLLLFDIAGSFKNMLLRNVVAVALILCISAVSIYCMESTTSIFANHKFRVYSPEYWRNDPSLPHIKEALELIPKDSRVSASGRYIPRLSYREKTYYFPIIKDAEYVCVSLSGESWPVSNEEYQAALKNLREGGEWSTIHNANNLLILKKE